MLLFKLFNRKSCHSNDVLSKSSEQSEHRISEQSDRVSISSVDSKHRILLTSITSAHYRTAAETSGHSSKLVIYS